MKYQVITILVLIISSQFNYAQSSKKAEREAKKQADYEEILEIVLSEKYEFQGRKANPQKGRQIDLTTRSNFLKIQKGSASASMPYFGRAFNVGYSTSDGGIKFDGPMETYDVEKNDKKRRINVKFVVKGPDDTFKCSLTISGSENAMLSVTSNKRQVISYTGQVKAIPEEKK